MNNLRILVILLASFSASLHAQAMVDSFPAPGVVTAEQYDVIEQVITSHPDAEIILQDPSVIQVSIEPEFTVCFIPAESHPAYPGIACRSVNVTQDSDYIVETVGWTDSADNSEFQAWLALFNVQDQQIKQEIVDSTGSNDEQQNP